MSNYIKFGEWKKTRYEKNESVKEVTQEKSSALLIAELEELEDLRKKAIRNKETYDAKLLELDIRLKKLEIEKTDILKKQKDLSEAKEIAKKTKLEAKSHDQK